jgi:adenylosuccinate synthase
MPASCVDKDVDVVFPAGSYLDVDLLAQEIEELKYPKERIHISRYAQIILPEHKAWEKAAGLVGAIGSTGSGVGGAVMALTAREAHNFVLQSVQAQHCEPLSNYIRDVEIILRKQLACKNRVVIEGTQGFGLSLLEGGHWPKATARCTTASAALAEAGLSPRDVDEVILVIRAFPIRVAGESGPLVGETTWEDIASRIGIADLREYTTVTKKLRRVGTFDSGLVGRAIAVNDPHKIVLNHLDYVDEVANLYTPSSDLRQFIKSVETGIGREIDLLGFSPYGIQNFRLNAAL